MKNYRMSYLFKGVKWICNSSEEAFKRLEDQAIKVTCLYGLEVESDVLESVPETWDIKETSLVQSGNTINNSRRLY